MVKLKSLLLFILTVIATSFSIATPEQDIVNIVIPIPPEQLQGGGNNFGLKIRAYLREPIDELSSYVVANLLTSVLADGDNLGEIGRRTMVYEPPYHLVLIDITPESTAKITRRLALDCLYQSIAWLSQHQFVRAEFTLMADERDIVKAAYTVHVPDVPVVSGVEDAGANQTLDIDRDPRVVPAYRPNGRDLTNAEVFISAIAATKSQAWQDKNARMSSFRDSVSFLDAYVEVRGIDSPIPDPELSVIGFIIAMWKMPFWMLQEGRLADISGTILYNEVPKGEALIIKGRPLAKGANPDTS